MSAPPPIGDYAFTREISNRDGWSIWQGENTVTKSPGCIKAIANALLSTLDRRTRFFRETSSLLDLRHPFIAELYETLEDASGRYLIFEWAENGSFAEFLSTRGPLGESLARVYFSQIIFALDYLHHERKQPHSAITSENIVLDHFNNMRLVDFGLRAQILQNGQYSMASLPPPWAAPEIIRGHPFSRASDVWGAGVLLYAMMCGNLPFGDSEDSVLGTEPTYQSALGPALIDLLKKMLLKSPDARITLEAIKKHHWFSQTQYSATLEAQFSQQRVAEAVIDKDIVKRMAALRMDVRALPQQFIERENTPLTSVYWQFMRAKSAEGFGALMEQILPQKQQQAIAFRFQFPGGKRPPALFPARPSLDAAQGPPNRVMAKSGGPKDTLPLQPPVRSVPRTLAPAPPTSARRMSKPIAVRTLLPNQAALMSAPPQVAADH
jgi:5'-AMP-activated protein kinase catalytic alpha subunit